MRNKRVCLQIVSDEPLKLNWGKARYKPSDKWMVMMVFFGITAAVVSAATILFFVAAALT